ncbi:hypothetical protein SNE40_010384 [Patella caerulea]|uniref:tRNA pseudouridine(55) synthase n=1 Tax=Patella caerulea TaxID=87958 RepID=A0AAN8PUH9_PATCE
MAELSLSKMQFEFFTTSDELALEISQALVSINCCTWCILRFLGEKRPCMYVNETVNELRQLLNAKDNTVDCVICPGCLGILHKYNASDFLQEIKSVVKKEDYEFIDYQCSLIVPVCTILRQHSIYLFLQEKHGSVYCKIPEEEISSIKDVWKWFCGPSLSKQLNSEFKQKSPFEISLIFKYEDSEKECYFLLETNPNEFQRRKKSPFDLFTRAAVFKAVTTLPDDVFKKNYQTPCLTPVKTIDCDISCNFDAIFIAGRYLKFSRTLSQTPWIIDGVRKTKSSVEEEICSAMSIFKATDFKFSSSGREDVDVRMLGNGRPFIVEILDAHRCHAVNEISAVQELINETSDVVKVRDLQLITREDIHNLKEGELEKSKCYMALCWSSSTLTPENIQLINQLKTIEIQQKTPLRVLHRRSQAVRSRMIYDISIKETKENYFKLYISTQAGTYIKEFVHGDFGRTVPNLSSLLNVDCDILTLDVQGVELKWPPQLDNDMDTK